MYIGFAKRNSQTEVVMSPRTILEILACTVILSSCMGMGSGIGHAGICSCQLISFLPALAYLPPPPPPTRPRFGLVATPAVTKRIHGLFVDDYVPLMRIRDLVLFWPMDPDPGSEMKIPDHFSESLKILEFFVSPVLRIRIRDRCFFDPGSEIRDGKMSIRDPGKHPGSAALTSTLACLKNYERTRSNVLEKSIKKICFILSVCLLCSTYM